MDVLSATVYTEQFLAMIRQGAPAAQTATVLHQRITAWMPYYRALQIVLGGNLPLAPAERAALFYLFAQATLDGIAETIRGFFSLPWTRAEFSHRRLTAVFPRLCTEYRLTGETQDISARLCDLQTRIVDYRHTSGAAHDSAMSHETLADLISSIDQYIVVLWRFLERNLEWSILTEQTPRCHTGRHVSYVPQPGAPVLPAPVPWMQSVAWTGYAPLAQGSTSMGNLPAS
jgi:hypothetical protein